MSKGLEALKYLKENKRKHWLDNDKSSECLNNIEKELRVVDIIRKYPGFIHWTFLKKFNSEEIELLEEVLL